MSNQAKQYLIILLLTAAIAFAILYREFVPLGPSAQDATDYNECLITTEGGTGNVGTCNTKVDKAVGKTTKTPTQNP